MCAPLVRRSGGFFQRLLAGDWVRSAVPRGLSSSAGLEPRPAAPLAYPHAADQQRAAAVWLAYRTGHTQPQVTHPECSPCPIPMKEEALGDVINFTAREFKSKLFYRQWN